MRGTEERASSVIPVEIYLGIIDYVSSSVDWYQDERRATLLNLALVCQFFYTATVPRLYDSLCFYGGPLREQNPGPINTVGFCRAIDNGRARATSLAYHVTECTLGWRGGGNRLDESLVAMFCGAFPQMSNLHTIILEFVTLYSPLLQTIDNLQSLRSLRLRDCGFADALINPQTELPEIFSTNEPIRTMSSLIYFVTQPTPRPSRVVSISTRAAHIDDRKRLPANHFNMALPLFPQGTAIVELRLEEMESTTTTWTIIASLNALQTLDIEHVVVPFDYTYPQELWASCLPHLQQLKISPSFTYIVVGRPISSLDLGSRESYSSPSSYFVRHNVSRQLPMSTFTNIMQSSADIVNLTIPVEFYLLEPLHKTFPALKTLCIMMQHHNFRCSSESFTDVSKFPVLLPSLLETDLSQTVH
ncbi:hypothetical protein C0991_004082 [Blastosporella zonata]|nr:hypothetical protein C0991_004082 [Blastosporella zonata]